MMLSILGWALVLVLAASAVVNLALLPFRLWADRVDRKDAQRRRGSR
jgi:hypothetical protein